MVFSPELKLSSNLPAAAADDHDALMQEVDALGDALAEAMLAGDVEEMLAAYAEDAISLPTAINGMRASTGLRELRMSSMTPSVSAP